jgi:hypothetical protein
MLAERCIAGMDVHKKMLAVVVGKTHEDMLFDRTI